MLEERKALDSLREELGRMWIIDTHEHIVAEDDWLKIPPQSLDFTHFFSHYASIDIISAGCPSTIWTRITSRETPLDEKWSLFEPYWQRARNTAYCRSVLMAIRDLFDLPDLSRETYRELSTRMSANQKTGWYQTVLKDRARIRKSVLNTSIMSPNPQFFAPVAYLDNFIMLGSREELSLCEKQCGTSIHSLDDLEKAIEKVFAEAVKCGAVATKIAVAYVRTLKFDNPSKADAEQSFTTLFALGGCAEDIAGPGQNNSLRQARPLEDYLVHKIIGMTTDAGLPIQIHTGLQEGNGNYLGNSNPLHLTEIFMNYPSSRFDIFHAGYPFTSEVGVLAKMFPGVYADMCWMHIISPSVARRTLDEWIETVPASKIFGFGGDYLFAEGAYAHSMLARENIARVLASKIADGYITGSEALRIAQMILHDNAQEFFKL